MLAILHDYIQLLLRVLLEGVSVEHRVARLTRSVIDVVTVAKESKSLYAARLYRRLSISELKLTVRDAVSRERCLRLRLVDVDHVAITRLRSLD